MRGRLCIGLAIFAVTASCGRALDVPTHLPRYDLTLTLDTTRRHAEFTQQITWTNPAQLPTRQLVLNFSPHYRIPIGDELSLAKTLELLRLNPSYGIDRKGRHGTIDSVQFEGRELPSGWKPSNQTALVVELPFEVGPGQSVTVTVRGSVRLPNKQGRWGQWRGITYFANALPVAAFYDDLGWHDVPFVPWHQPFWNEAGIYRATLVVPEPERVACSADEEHVERLPNNWKRVTFKPFVGRDFAVVTSANFHEHHVPVTLPSGRTIDVRCLACPDHDYYGRQVANIAAAAIPVFSQWFGDFPYDHFTLVESYFGWNGNELGGMVLIDERVFDMPEMAHGYVEYLVSHETCHQWWYNLVGSNGFSETFMDEGAATHFTHRLLDERHGKNNRFLNWPAGYDFLPNIRRENYRYASITGAIRRGDVPAAAGDLPEFGHLYALFSGAYDRGSKVYALIEARLGEAAFQDFIRQLVAKYSFRVLSAAQLKQELTEYAGPQSAAMWDELFNRWVYSNGLVDWKVDSVSVAPRGGPRMSPGVRVAVELAQVREYDESTTLGFQFAGGDGFPVRVPVSMPGGGVPAVNDPYETEVVPAGPGRVTVRVTLPNPPEQVTVDPDNVLMDADRGNNSWRQSVTARVVPIYTFLYETDLTNDYDRWNLTAGPWIGGALYPDPWYTRTTMLGARAGAYRTQEFTGGAYVAVRSDYRDFVGGVDGLWDHFPTPNTQVGFNYEHRLAGPWDGTNGRDTAQRGVLFGRYILQLGSSLYLPPISYVDIFTTYQDNFLPFARNTTPGAVRPSWTWTSGAHYRLNLLTPYWDAERGIWVDASYAGGTARLGERVGTHQGRIELATTQKLPDGLGYLSDVKVALRGVVHAAFPARGQFLALGGGLQFRGFDLAERQGSALWVANAEVRLPVLRDIRWDRADHLVGLRNLQLAAFYDVGQIYADQVLVGGNTAHALGIGLRADLAVFSFIERATVRLDFAKTISEATPMQVWFGVQQPF